MRPYLICARISCAPRSSCSGRRCRGCSGQARATANHEASLGDDGGRRYPGEARLLEQDCPRRHRDWSLLDAHEVAPSVLDDPPPATRTLAREDAELAANDGPVPG